MSDEHDRTPEPEQNEGTVPDDAADERARTLQAQLDDRPTISMDQYRRTSRRSFLTAAAGVVGAGLFWQWVQNQPTDDGIPQVLRNTLEANEGLWRNVSQSRMAPEFPVSKATPIQVTGTIGIRDELDLDNWLLRVEGPDGQLLDEVDLATMQSLPQDDMVIEHKCIEGWSSIVHWGGVRFRDFHERYADQVGDAPYVGLETPDGEYYVGWDRDAILHPQTMLVLRQGTEPLTEVHGAPLRLATPNKYGIKCLKRIGVIRYSNERPADYWAERSYDWYAGL